MPSPFPGMDPYLERPEVFPDFHDSFITYLRENLQANLPAPYFAAIGRRVWIEMAAALDRAGRPRDPSRPRRPGQGGAPRRPGRGDGARGGPGAARRIPRAPDRDLRQGERREAARRLPRSAQPLQQDARRPRARPLPPQAEGTPGGPGPSRRDRPPPGRRARHGRPARRRPRECGEFDYHVSVHRFDDLETFFVYPIRLEDRLPTIEVPLLPGDPPVPLDLQAVFDRCYDAGPYAREIGYGSDPLIPPLGPRHEAWAERTLQGR